MRGGGGYSLWCLPLTNTTKMAFTECATIPSDKKFTVLAELNIFYSESAIMRFNNNQNSASRLVLAIYSQLLNQATHSFRTFIKGKPEQKQSCLPRFFTFTDLSITQNIFSLVNHLSNYNIEQNWNIHAHLASRSICSVISCFLYC